MTIDEAITILTAMGTPEYRGSTESIIKARNLGIEALKWFKEWRSTNPSRKYTILLGETIKA